MNFNKLNITPLFTPEDLRGLYSLQITPKKQEAKKMVNENLKKFIEETERMKIDPEVKEEISMLYNLGVDLYELEYLAYVKTKEEITLKES